MQKRPPASAGGLFVLGPFQSLADLFGNRDFPAAEGKQFKYFKLQLNSDQSPAIAGVWIAGLTTRGVIERIQPAESHARGTENSDQPQSRQTLMSGDGVMGG